MTGERPTCKTLYLCFEASYWMLPRACSLFMLPVEKLFHDCVPILEEIWLDASENGPAKMSCGKIGSEIYFVGGSVWHKEAFFPRYCPSDLSSTVVVVDTALLDLTSSLPCPSFPSCLISSPSKCDWPPNLPKGFSIPPPMNSGKFAPLVVDVDEMLYVLAGVYGPRCPPYDDPVFEAYNRVTCSWEKLDIPPFMDPECKYCAFPGYQGYVVIDRKICVSTSRASFAYDVDARAWGPCQLFDGAPDPFKLRLPWNDSEVILPRFPDETLAGPPFGFDGLGLLYSGDILLCLVYSIPAVVAYQLAGGKVVGVQVLKGFKLPNDFEFGRLADLGSGFFCLIQTLTNFDECCAVSLTTFSVKRLVADSSNFLASKILSHFHYQVQTGYPTLSPIGLFAISNSPKSSPVPKKRRLDAGTPLESSTF